MLMLLQISSESIDYQNFIKILQDIPTKANWKKEIKYKIQEYWEKQWIEEAKRTSLKFLAIPKMGKTHYVWKTVANDSIEVKKAEVKVRLLTGTYVK